MYNVSELSYKNNNNYDEGTSSVISGESIIANNHIAKVIAEDAIKKIGCSLNKAQGKFLDKTLMRLFIKFSILDSFPVFAHSYKKAYKAIEKSIGENIQLNQLPSDDAFDLIKAVAVKFFARQENLPEEVVLSGLSDIDESTESPSPSRPYDVLSSNFRSLRKNPLNVEEEFPAHLFNNQSIMNEAPRNKRPLFNALTSGLASGIAMGLASFIQGVQESTALTLQQRSVAVASSEMDTAMSPETDLVISLALQVAAISYLAVKLFTCAARQRGFSPTAVNIATVVTTLAVSLSFIARNVAGEVAPLACALTTIAIVGTHFLI